MNSLQNIVFVGAQGGIWVEGLSTFVVGISVVFIALIVLIILLEISGRFFAQLDKKAAQKKAQSQVVAPVKPVEVAPTVEESSEMDDLELVAVITATIAASMGTSTDRLQVRSLRKTNNSWTKSGRNNQLYN